MKVHLLAAAALTVALVVHTDVLEPAQVDALLVARHVQVVVLDVLDLVDMVVQEAAPVTVDMVAQAVVQAAAAVLALEAVGLVAQVVVAEHVREHHRVVVVHVRLLV